MGVIHTLETANKAIKMKSPSLHPPRIKFPIPRNPLIPNPNFGRIEDRTNVMEGEDFMKKYLIRGFVCALAMSAIIAVPSAGRCDDNAPVQSLTFYKDIAPILQENCQNCHRPSGVNMGGMVAPMPLVSYADVRPWVKSITQQINAKRMPPWHAASEFSGVFANERGLSKEAMETFAKWVNSGAPEGRPEDAPKPAVYATGEWAIGQPDLVLEMPKPYFVKDDVEDLYINFTTQLTEAQLPEDKYIQGLEFKAGSKVVHHIIGYAYAPGSKIQTDRGMLGGIAPGNDPDHYPDGYGLLLKKGSKFVFAMHYHKEKGPGTGVWDVSKAAIKFHAKPVKHQLHIDAIGNHDFEIPPGHPNWEVGSARVFDKDTTIMDLMPHMHVRGKDAKYVAFYPDGTQETLLYVPRYDFNWQTGYEFKTPKKIPAGTRIEVTMHFDNSKGNAANPDSSVPVHFGGPTTDEMMLGWLTYCSTDPEKDEKPDGKAEIASAKE